ncbi:MAG: HxsD-like protein [Deltaproteobacteria bacterium]|nr:HxsD-like protein [Deltaproteobacteria bacterium]
MATTKADRKTEPRGRARRTLQLDAAIYRRAALERARRAFGDLAAIEITRQGRNHVLRFSGMRSADAQRTVDEFVNYALACLVIGA